MRAIMVIYSYIEDKLDDRVQKVEQEKEDLKKALAAKGMKNYAELMHNLF